jgi:hypothetical protein
MEEDPETDRLPRAPVKTGQAKAAEAAACGPKNSGLPVETDRVISCRFIILSVPACLVSCPFGREHVPLSRRVDARLPRGPPGSAHAVILLVAPR